ncbi:MAG: arginine--tRNA ligase [Candidatus Falkowbacteria bacterium]|nr:arginine--tRNA ligase [Candidatus Falkowbacteria bacterium]
MKTKIAALLAEKIKELGAEEVKITDLLAKIEIPPTRDLGDFAFPCFVLAKELALAPAVIANKLANLLAGHNSIQRAEVVGPYLNLFVDRASFAISVLDEVLENPEEFGNAPKNDKKIVIEFPSPNTNKPLHLGHLRNMAIGESLARLLEANGEKVFRTNLFNDRGVHICKSMLAYQKEGKNAEPDKKSDHFVGDYYVKFGALAKENPELEQEIQEMLLKWESGDQETIALWQKMNEWAFSGFRETFKLVGIKHDKNYFESEIYQAGKDLVLKYLASGVFSKREDGAVVIDLTADGLDEKVLLRADGTSVYMTQDLHLAFLKEQDYHYDDSIYIVGNEQDYHFKVLALVLQKMGFAKKISHLSYGMIALPEGRMKSREGTVVDADNLVWELVDLAKEGIIERNSELDGAEADERAMKIALAAIKYKLLKANIFKNMIFDPKESLSFDGDTGPYLLYSFARANSILAKVPEAEGDFRDTANLEDAEFALIQKIAGFREVLAYAGESRNPSLVAHYAFELAQIFNEFYHSCQVANSENTNLRLKLVEAFSLVLQRSLYILGIEILEKM